MAAVGVHVELTVRPLREGKMCDPACELKYSTCFAHHKQYREVIFSIAKASIFTCKFHLFLALQSLPLCDQETTVEPSSSKVVVHVLVMFIAGEPPMALVYAVLPTTLV